MDQHDTSPAVPDQPVSTLPSQPLPESGVERVDIQVAGMTYAHCAGRITQALQEVTGVRQANVNHSTGVAGIGLVPFLQWAVVPILSVLYVRKRHRQQGWKGCAQMVP